MNRKIIQRIMRGSGLPNVEEILGGISSADLQSLLLSVFQKQVEHIAPAQLLRNYSDNRFAAPAPMDAALSLKLDLLGFSLLPEGFQVLELSPVAPLGTCAAVAPVNQNKVISTIRNTEVVADATNVLALECSRRRKALLESDPRSTVRIRLCASHRHTRCQPITDKKFTPHFKVFCLCTAGRDEGNFRFESESLAEHIDFYIRFLQHVLTQSRKEKRIEVFLTDFSGKFADALNDRILSPLAGRFPDVSFASNPRRQSARNYYKPVCFNIRLSDGDGATYDYLADGGLVDWTQQLLSNSKERLLASGIGTELLTRVVPIDLADGSLP